MLIFIDYIISSYLNVNFHFVLKIWLLPTSVLIRKGHKLRIALAGADKDTCRRYPDEGTPTITIKRENTHPSFIDIPIIANEDK